MNVLVVAPHPDDESIGCGGTICLHVDRGDRVSAAFLTSGELGLKHLPAEEAKRVREREASRAAKVLGISSTTFLRQPDWFLGDAIAETARLLSDVLEREVPELIYFPHDREWHPDHSACLPIVRQSLDSASIPAPTLLAYEVWTPLQEYYRIEDISPLIARKMKAIRCHRSQLDGFRYDRAAFGLSRFRGALTIGCRHAEVFQLHRAARLD